MAVPQLSFRYRMAAGLSGLLIGLIVCFGSITGVLAETTPVGYSLSADQQTLIDELGLPQRYQIIIVDQDQESGVSAMRHETWFYDQVLTSFTFANGAFSGSEPIEDAAGFTNIPRLPPNSFHSGMDWESTRRALGNPKFALYTVSTADLDMEIEVDVSVSLYFTDEAILGFSNDRLLLVMAIPPGQSAPASGD